MSTFRVPISLLAIWWTLTPLAAVVVAEEVPPAVESDWKGIVSAASLELHGHNPEPIEHYEKGLADPETHPTVALQAHRSSADLHSSHGDPKTAVSHITFLLQQELPPVERPPLLSLRANLNEERGLLDEARADRLMFDQLLMRSTRPEESLPDWELLTLRRSLEFCLRWIFPGWFEHFAGRCLILLILGSGLCLLVLPYNLSMGNRQRREGAGTWRRLILVAFVMGVIQAVPIQSALGLLLISASEMDIDNALILAPILFLIISFWTGLYLLPPLRWSGSSDGLPKVTDVQFQTRLRSMSEQLGIATPVARMLPSCGGIMGLQGFAGGLPQPSLIVSDGILMRLSPYEAAAIVAHELGHIANGSIWCFPLAFSLAWSAGVPASLWLGVWGGVLFGAAFQTGVSRIVSRYFEYDCDRRAAQLVGYAQTVAALDKIHMTSLVRNSGWLSFFAYSMATHPSQAERLQALAEIAPPHDRPTVTWSKQTARFRKYSARGAFVIWLMVLGLSFLIPDHSGWQVLRNSLYLTIFLAPTLLLQKAVRKDVQTEMKRRQVAPKRKINWFVFGITVVIMLMLFFVLDQTENFDESDSIGEMIGILFVIPLVFAILVVAWGIWRGAKSPQARIRLAIHQRRWTDAVALGQESADKIQSDAPLRHDLNLALWMTGDQEKALAAMQQLRAEFPEFKHPWLIQSLMHLERGETERAVQLLEEVRDALPDDVGVLGIAARCARIQGNVEQMATEANSIERIIPDAAAVSAFRCAICLDKNDFETAFEHWKEAERLAPGDAYITLLKAELDFQTGDRQTGDLALASAKRLIDATPFAFLGSELRHVEKLMDKAEVVPGSKPFQESE